MKSKFVVVIVMVFIVATLSIIVQAQTSQEIVWEYKRTENIPQNADILINKLEEEVTEIVDAGHLMPFRMQYGEDPRYYPVPSHENEFDEPWTMMFTLAKAYPYVSNDLKTQIIDYIRNENDLHAPWLDSALGASGFYRQGDPVGIPEHGLPNPDYTRKGTMLYALWLYGYATNDWSDIQPQWSNLQTIYNQIYSSHHTYELISGAIAMSRMAEQFGDGSLRVQYENDAITLMNEGLDFDTFNSNAINAQTRWSDLTEWNRGSYGIAYPLFYLTPEVARYMSNQTNLRNTIDIYIYAEPQTQPSGSGGGGYAVEPLSVTWLWPLWWMAQAPIGDGGYFGEGCAAGSEQRMMLFNYYAWVRNEPSATLRYYLDVPDALVGDLYYIQNLVTTIESYGQTCWEDTITGFSNCEVIDDTLPPVRNNGKPSDELESGTTQTIISLSTDESATCRYSTTSGVVYNSMTNTFSTTGGTTHSTLTTGLQDGQTYRYYTKCQDTNNNSNTNDYIITFSIAQQIICTDNDGDTYSVEGESCGSVDCNDNNNAIHPGAIETCNNVDDNCVNGIDENLQRDCSLNYQGICAIGTESCSAGVWTCCPTPQQEICDNAIDEDCNGIDQPCQIEITNILQNGDFELGTAQYWETITDSQITSTVVHSENYAVQITDNSASQGWITVTPGQTYVFSGWFRWDQFSNNEWGYDRFRVMNTNWEDIAVLNNMHIRYEQGQWHKLALTFTPDTDGVRVNFGLYGPETTVEMYFDDLMLFEKIGNIPPTINPTSDITSGNVPLTVQFYTNGDDVDGAIEYYNWDFGDGTVSRLENPSHTFIGRGTYLVNLTVWDNDGTTVSQIITVQVNDNSAPTISITSPSSSEYYGTSQSSVILSGNAQSSNENIIDIVWDNINTDEAGILSINPSASLSWTTPQTSLKPGKNEILVTATDSHDRIDTEKIIVYRQISGPSVSNIQVNSNNIRVYEKYEVSFDLETAAENYFFDYDTNPPEGVPIGKGITVEGIFRTPTGQVLTQPGFYYKEAINQNGVYEETGTENWVIRLSPQEIGQYDVSLRVQDTSGSVTVPIGTFSALTPVKQGFIKVSDDDSRYFEFSNGDLFWPLGHVIETDYSLNKGTGLNLERPWMGGRGAYSTNWAKWISSAEQHGNEGYMSRLNYEYHYPSHELSREIFYPNGYRIRIPCWGDETFCHNLNPNTDYQIKLRLKTVDISGPVDPSRPYGFVVKQSNWWSTADPIPSDVLNRESIITPVNVDRDWHTIVSTYTTSSSTYSEFNLYLENVNSGEVYIDQFSVREILLDGTLGPEQIRQSKGDMHTYVEQRPAAYFDWQVEQGEENDVFFKYVVHDKNDWIQNHLLDIGIFHDAGHGYYQNEDTKARWLLRQWYRYLIARWGYSTAIHSWELNNEGSPNAESHWRTTQYFAEFMHDNDAHPHLATTSFWSEWVPQFWGDNTNYPDVDYADLHQYSHDNFEYTTDAAFFHSDVSRIVSESAVSKPVIRGETGLSETGDTLFNYLSQPNPGIWFHNLIWAQLNSGGMSDPNYWWSQHRNQIDSPSISTPFYLFIQDLDINKGGYVDLNVQLNNPDLRVYGQKNLAKNQAHMWIQNMYHTWRNVMGVENPQTISQESGSITVQMNPNTDYNVMWWDTYNGVEQNTQSLISDSSGNLVLTITNLYDDVAVKITSTTDTSPPSRSNGQPIGVLASGTTQTTISLNTDESATCRYSTTSGVVYTSMSNTFSTSDNIYHSSEVTGLQNGQSYSYYIKCMDQNNNANTNDFTISFSVAQPIVCTDNDGDTYSVEGGFCGSVDCDDNNGNINPGATEVCNNVDDNCANGIDENLQRTCSLNYQGLCAVGTESCSAGVWSGCPSAQTEICGNGVDEDCNGIDLVCPSAPRIFEVRPFYISPTETRIMWRTDIPSTSQVEYGTMGENDLTRPQTYESITIEDVSLVTDHIVIIDNLQSETRYHFRVISTDNTETSYSKDLLFATFTDAMKLHPGHEQLDSVIVDGLNVRIKKMIVPYKDDMANITINELNWTNPLNIKLVTPNVNHSINLISAQEHEVNLSQEIYLLFETSPPTKQLLNLVQNSSIYRKTIEIRSPNHFYNVEASEEINFSYSSWVLYQTDNERQDVTNRYNFRISGNNAVFDSFNTSNITFEIEGNNECTENWDCSDWSSCSDSQQTRTCTDLNNCGTEDNKPSEQQSCISEEDSGSSSSGGGGISFFMPCNPDWLCGVWNPSICPSTGVQTRNCIDQNNCEIPLIETQQCTYITLEGEIIETQPATEKPGQFCGNDRIDEGENSETCCKDVGCPIGYTCTVLNSCIKNSRAKIVNSTLKISLLVILISGLILFVISKLSLSYKHDKQVKSRTDYRQYLTILKDFMLRAENKGKSEHKLEEELKKIGWDKTYIKDAEKEIKKERKFIGKVKKKKS